MSCDKEKFLVVRFGGIGDFVSALSYCNSTKGCDLFFSPSISSLFQTEKNDQQHLLKVMPFSSDVVVRFGNIRSLIKLINLNRYYEVIVYAQSAGGYGLMLFTFLLRLLLVLNNVKVRQFFFGGQYVHLLNECSQIRSLVKSLPDSPIVSIFFDSKESANNLSELTVIEICRTLSNSLSNPKISVYGLSRLELGNHELAINNASGLTTFDELRNVFLATDLAITCDSGPFHIFLEMNTPCITFVSARQSLLNWTPAKPNVYYIFDERVDCLGCGKAICPKTENLCVNSDNTRRKFFEIFE